MKWIDEISNKDVDNKKLIASGGEAIKKDSKIIKFTEATKTGQH